MWRPVAPTGTARAAAIGWFVTSLGTDTLVDKHGGQPGFTALVQLVPERELGLVVLVNESPEGVHASGVLARTSRLVLDELLPRAVPRRP
jgi:hypothetical protein